MTTIPDRIRDLLADETRALLYLATTMPDGTPQLTPVWFNFDGEYILINAAAGRVKDRNMRERPYVACLIMDPDNHFRYVQIRGPVVEITEAGADDHGRDLTFKYLGHRNRDYTGETRVIYKIRPDHVWCAG
ncbi:MAG: PPOX class F420-dependent oxidoreductase [Anaerolineae bacterium]|nr:PPOX class F420-dependent oxidoreductase [Anaerolineae bacterium]